MRKHVMDDAMRSTRGQGIRKHPRTRSATEIVIEQEVLPAWLN